MAASIAGWQVAAVAGGAAAGAVTRWLAGLWLNPVWPVFPLGTLVVNLLGGFAIGALAATLEPSGTDLWRLLLVTGFLGGMTTFSAFSIESLQMLMRGQAGLALAHALAHVLGALACAALGWYVAHAIA